MQKSKVKLYYLFGIVALIAILTPHIVHGHILIPERYAESVILILDLLLAYVFYLVYKRDVNKINQDKSIVQQNLLASYKYIGQSNIQLDLFNQFINSLSPRQNGNKLKEKNIFQDLLQTMVSSVAKASKGLIRFIDADGKRTIKEYSFHKDGDQFVVKLSNIEALDHNEIKSPTGDVKVIQSDYNNSKIKCVFCYSSHQSKSKVDYKLLKTLLNQIHLLFLVSYSRI